MKRLLSLLFIAVFTTLAFAADTNFAARDWGLLKVFGNNGSIQTFLIDQTTDKVAHVFQAPAACAITDLGYSYGTRTGTPVQHQISLQGVSTTTGLADGTIKSSTNAKGLFTPPASTADNGKTRYVALTSSYTPTRGEYLSIVIEPIGTPDASNNGTFGYNFSNELTGSNIPYSYTINGGGAATKISGLPTLSFKCGSTVYGVPMETWSATDFGDDSTSDEFGNSFTTEAISSTEVICGARWRGDFSGASKAARIKLYDSGSTLLAHCDIDTDIMQRNDGAFVYSQCLFVDTTLPTLTIGSQYRIALRCDSNGGTSCDIFSLLVTNTSDLGAYPGGTNIIGTKRGNDGAWTDDTSRRYAIEPIYCDITKAAGGSSTQKAFSPGFQP